MKADDRLPTTQQSSYADRDAARRSVGEFAQACVARAVELAIPDDVSVARLVVSDVTFQRLHACVERYATLLQRLGEGRDQAAEIILAVVQNAVRPAKPHHAVTAAVREWTLAAYDAAATPGSE
jgi:hypothetical protein